MTDAQIKSEPSIGTGLITPGPHYDLPSCADPRSIKIGSSLRTFSPEKGTSSAGPFISA